MKLFLILIGSVFFYNQASVIGFNSKTNFPLYNPESPVYDVLVLSKDTILLSTVAGLSKSYDEGKTWQHYDHNYGLKELAMEKKRLWGIAYWPGVHHKGNSTLYFSDDFGETWTIVKLNNSSFFPKSFLELNGELFIVGQGGSLWRHKNFKIESHFNWQKIYPLNGDWGGHTLGIHNNKYLTVREDSVHVFDIYKGTSISYSGKTDNGWSISEMCFFKEDSMAGLDSRENFYKVSIRDTSYKELIKLQGYWSCHDLINIGNKFYVFGYGISKGENDVQNPALCSVIGSDLKQENIPGLPGGNLDFLRVDKNKRIWCQTSDGIFVLNPNAKSFRKYFR